MKKLYILDGNDELSQYYVDYDENALARYINIAKDYLPDLDSIVRMENYYRNSSLLNGNVDYTSIDYDGYRVILNNSINILSNVRFEEKEIISLKAMRERIEENIVIGYDLYKNQHLKYGLKDYQDIIVSQVDRLFDEYRKEASDNTKVLAKSFIKKNTYI